MDILGERKGLLFCLPFMTKQITLQKASAITAWSGERCLDVSGCGTGSEKDLRGAVNNEAEGKPHTRSESRSQERGALKQLHRIPRESGKEVLTFYLLVFGNQSNGSTDKLRTNLTDNINIGKFWATFCFHV